MGVFALGVWAHRDAVPVEHLKVMGRSEPTLEPTFLNHIKYTSLKRYRYKFNTCSMFLCPGADHS